MMMTKIKYLLIIALVTLSLPMAAQKLFSLEDLNFGGSNYRNLQPENKWLTWWGDELIRTDVDECYLIDKKTGKETRLFTLDEVNKWANSDEEANRYVRHLMNATFPYPDQPLVALGNKKSFLLLDFKKHEIVWQDSISGQTANDWNKTSRATAYVEDHQLFVVDGEGKKHQLSTDGSREIVYGQSVHRNEFGIEKGTFWSPDGQRLAFYRMDQSMVTDYPQVDIFPREATHEPDKYPMAGMNAHVVTVGVYDLATGKTVYLKTPNGSVTGDFVTDTKPIYFTNIAWSPDAKTIYMFELNRDQNDCRLVSYDATTGERIAELYRETSDKYVEPMNPIQFLPWDSSKFIMQSQRDGYNHLYLYNKDGKLLSQLTSGAWVVQDVLGFNTKQKGIIIEANKYHPLHRQLYSVNVSNGKITQLTVADGVHHGTLSANNRTDCTGALFTLVLPTDESAYTEEEKKSLEPAYADIPAKTPANDVVDVADEQDSEDKRSKVLVVDDDTEVVHYLRTLLAPEYKVIYCFDAESALKAAREEEPQLILSDVVMPGMSGYELCHMIKDDLQTSHIPVVLVTAKITDENKVEGLNSGADAYVTKPFAPKVLMAMIKSLLTNRERVRTILTSTTETDKDVEDVLSAQDKHFMDELYQMMEKEMANAELDVNKATEMMHVSRTKLYYKVKGLTGESPSTFFKTYKLNKAAELIKAGEHTISEIAFMTGFNTLSHFSTSFKKQFGCTPSEYGKKKY